MEVITIEGKLYRLKNGKPVLTDEQKVKNSRASAIRYYYEHKEECDRKARDRANQYYEEHKEEINRRAQLYYNEHRDDIIIKRRTKRAATKQNTICI